MSGRSNSLADFCGPDLLGDGPGVASDWLVVTEAEGPWPRSDCKLGFLSLEELASQWCMLRPWTVGAKEDRWGEEGEDELEVRPDGVDIGLLCFFAS